MRFIWLSLLALICVVPFAAAQKIDPVRQVKWPSGCLGVYAPASNTCVAPGTAANPPGSTFDVPFNGGGTFSSDHGFFSYNPATHTLTTAGNSVYGFNPPVWSGPSGISSVDNGLTIWQGQINTATVSGGNWATSNQQRVMYFITPGWSRAVGGINWAVHGINSWSMTGYTEGIQNGGITNLHTAPGDSIPWYLNNYWYDGATAGGDESEKEISGGNVEQPLTYTATINSGSGGVGASSLQTTCSSDCKRQGQGRYLIDTTQPLATGCYITSHTGPSNAATPAKLGVAGCTITPSTAVGTQVATINTPLNNPATSSSPQTFTLNVTSGTFVAGGFICFSATFHECAVITSATAPSGGQQTLTVPLREYHGSGGLVVQGGTQGYIDIAAQHGEGGLTYPLDVIGAPDSSDIYVKSFFKADQQVTDFTTTNINLSGVSVTTLSNSGTTVSFTFSGNISNTFGPFNKATAVTFTGASDTAFNAPCTSPAWSGSNTAVTGTCTIAGLSGTHTAASATMFLGDTPNGNGDFTLYPGAEVLDVQDPALIGTCATSTPDCMVDGYLALEPNQVAWAVGDSVVEPHHYAVQAATVTLLQTVHNPNNFQGTGISEAFTGVGNNSGNYSAGSTSLYASFQAVNNAPYTTYAYGGNSNMLPPNAFSATSSVGGAGVFQNILWGKFAPAFAGNVVNVGPPETGASDPLYYYNLASLSLNGASYAERVIPSQNAILFEAPSGSVSLMFGAGTSLWYYRSGLFDSPSSYAQFKPGGLTASFGTFPIWLQNSWTGGKLVQSSSTNGGQVESGAALTGGGANVPTMANSSGFGVGHIATFANTAGELQDGGPAPTASSSGSAILASGTATVPTAAACTVGSSCNYLFTNCGPAGTAIGVPSLGAVTAGTSFVINSISSTNTVATGDTSKICWRIN